jgi:hypothetical protein
MPPPEQRRRALRDALGALVPGWRPLAENVLGADARIDWVGRDVDGRCVIALVGSAGGDLALVAEGLAQRAWVAARVADWAQLAPEAGLRPSSEVSVVLLAPSFRPAAIEAARAAAGPASSSPRCASSRTAAQRARCSSGSASPAIAPAPSRPVRASGRACRPQTSISLRKSAPSSRSASASERSQVPGFPRGFRLHQIFLTPLHGSIPLPPQALKRPKPRTGG